MRWEIINQSKTENLKADEIMDIVLSNRGLATAKEKKEFLNPTEPQNISLKELQIDGTEVKKSIKRIEKAKDNKELVFVYGDYDADGICSTAIIWETLNAFGVRALPHIPDRFEEGYGINPQSVESLKKKFPEINLIITVDNGIVAHEGISKAVELGIDVIILDHHAKGETLPPAFSIVHTTVLSGSGIAWFFCREIPLGRELKTLELAAIGTVADQLTLIGANRSLVKYGIEELNKTSRLGLKELFDDSGLTIAGMLVRPISTFEINYIIAPRINAMGRLKHGLDSLRLICTLDRKRARDLAKHLSDTNIDRQKIVEQVTASALVSSQDSQKSILILSGSGYHEGVIGLAAGRIAEQFYKPAIVMSVKGEIAKASARSISGFNIIEAIRKFKHLYIEGGGHPMAAGFSIRTENIEKFSEEMNTYAKSVLTEELLERKLKIDLKIKFQNINFDLSRKLKEIEPMGNGNPAPVFTCSSLKVKDAKTVGKENKHFKLKLEQDGQILDAIFFGGGELYPHLKTGDTIDSVFHIEDNVWNGHTSLQLKIKDIKLSK